MSRVIQLSLSDANIIGLKREKAVSRKRLIEALDSLVSKIVIERDKVCVICGSNQNLTAGHVFSRRGNSTRWSLKNVFAQCWPCNYRHVYDQYVYFDWYIKKFGYDKFVELRSEYRKLKMYSKDWELLELLRELNKIYEGYKKVS